MDGEAWWTTVYGVAGSDLTEQHSCTQEGGPLPGPASGLLSNTWKCIV